LVAVEVWAEESILPILILWFEVLAESEEAEVFTEFRDCYRRYLLHVQW
jgi:hypothetical protein